MGNRFFYVLLYQEQCPIKRTQNVMAKINPQTDIPHTAFKKYLARLKYISPIRLIQVHLPRGSLQSDAVL